MSPRKPTIFDVTLGIRADMPVWPGDPKVQVNPILRMSQKDKCNLSGLSMGLHTGTHIDAPFHFIRSGRTIDTMPLTAMIGPVRVVFIRHAEQITRAELVTKKIRRGERILFKTNNSTWYPRAKKFKKNFVYIPEDSACYLVEKQVDTVGIDYMSVGGYKKDGRQVHQRLLKAGIWLIEGLILADVPPGKYQMICLPLKVIGADGAPARVILIKK